MSEVNTASLYASPEDARKAPAEEFLYLACLHQGTGVQAPDFIAGEFSRLGVSSTRYTACLFEFTLVQMRTERWPSLQLLMLIGRLLRHWRQAVR